MKLQTISVLAAALLLAGCTPKIVPQISKSATPLSSTAEVSVIEIDAPQPANAEVLGTVRIGDNGFTSAKAGSYENVISLAKEEARRAGGNAIKITSHDSPDAQSSGHRSKTTILKVDKKGK
jgi:hypothetical protein